MNQYEREKSWKTRRREREPQRHIHQRKVGRARTPDEERMNKKKMVILASVAIQKVLIELFHTQHINFKLK